MRTFIERLNASQQQPAYGQLTLPFQLRQKSRQKTQLDSGETVALMLPRGFVLRDGDYLRAENGEVVSIQAALEQVNTAATDDAMLLAKACYHLGNRHVPLQIGAGWVRYENDAVLSDMVQGLGLSILREAAPFEPESGAYGGAGHQH